MNAAPARKRNSGEGRFSRSGGRRAGLSAYAAGIEQTPAERGIATGFAEILRAAGGNGSWQAKLQHLVSVALENGGADNITALFAVIGEEVAR